MTRALPTLPDSLSNSLTMHSCIGSLSVSSMQPAPHSTRALFLLFLWILFYPSLLVTQLRCHLLRVAVLGLHSQLLSFIWFCFSFYSFIFVTPCSIWDLNFLTRDWNPWLLHCKCGVLTTGPPGKPLILLYFLNSIYDLYDMVLFIIFLNRSIMTGWTGQKIFLFTQCLE